MKLITFNAVALLTIIIGTPAVTASSRFNWTKSLDSFYVRSQELAKKPLSIGAQSYADRSETPLYKQTQTDSHADAPIAHESLHINQQKNIIKQPKSMDYVRLQKSFDQLNETENNTFTDM